MADEQTFDPANLTKAAEETFTVRRVFGEAYERGGATIIPWPPGPTYRGRQLAYVYNVYTEPEHRGRGLARRVMDAIHAFCRDRGIESVGLNASSFGQPLYESMGYHVTPSPMMFLSLKERAV